VNSFNCVLTHMKPAECASRRISCTHANRAVDKSWADRRQEDELTIAGGRKLIMTTDKSVKKRGFLQRLLDSMADRAARFALRAFDQDQDELRRSFLQLAQSSGKPRGLRWATCEWLPERVLLRDPETALLTLCVGLNVSFEAIPGGDMEDVAAVGTVRDACAIFHFQDGRWGTAGRVLFNHSPELAADRIDADWVRVTLPG
jgi:hypothetical protein